ncbi:Hypothetical predicted protein [Mytilus galloprovincialis]|uniref:Uncharacterized protein n=1 Tax=Mytilus galloprovincialis TaxID=29158 RepID=A0A8B6G925_MYTGA|nr:Hypothetical predicted protein [Mytilus galloprovincialis]
MVSVGFFLLECASILTLISAAGIKTDPCGVSGNWTNQFGSTMAITCQQGSPTTSQGSINGKYMYTPNNLLDLSGRYTMINRDCILGFSIVMDSTTGNSNTTSWTGIHYATENTIHTHWILAKHTEYNDMWKNTHIGTAVFTRTDKLENGGGVIG